MILGLILIVLGIFVRVWAIKSSQGRFSLSIGLPSVIFTKGIYKYIRHPSYLGSILILTGMFLLCKELAFFYFVFVFFLSRSIQEENILSQSKEYQEYKQKTGMFLPRIK